MRAVLVIDMVRGFLEEGHALYGGKRLRAVIPHVAKLVEKELSAGSKIFFVHDSHEPDDSEFNMFPPHCVKGTPETELIAELAGYPGVMVPKTRYSAFYNTTLDNELQAAGAQELIICGVLTDICVLHTVADARNRNYQVSVPVDCVASPSKEAHRFALKHMQRVLGAHLIGEVPPQGFDPTDEVLQGETADVYFNRTIEILRRDRLNPVATMEFFPSRNGILCGMREVRALLEEVLPQGAEVWALEDGESFAKKEVILRICAPYQSYGRYETAICGMISHSSGWATAARECVEEAAGTPVISFGARHLHPSVAHIMDYAAIVGGCSGCSSVLGAKLAGIAPAGTMPHALVLIYGDTVLATMAFDHYMAPEVPRISLVDTFKDEPEEAIRVAEALGGRLDSVRLDTPGERGGVTPELVKETRARLDLAGFNKVGIFVSGGVTPARIQAFHSSNAPVAGFGVGSYITSAPPIDITADLHEIEGRPIAKRGRIPGRTPNPRLKRIV